MPSVPVATLYDEKHADTDLMLAAAEKEMCAFLRAAGFTFGPAAAERAAELWIATLDAMDVEKIVPDRDFRTVTIQAAAQLAADITGRAFTARASFQME